jgi:hypothetical protein
MNSLLDTLVPWDETIEEESECTLPAELVPDRKSDTGGKRLLQELPPGTWRSLGKYLDYTNWADRERFIELDRAIQLAAQIGEEADEPFAAGAGYCMASAAGGGARHWSQIHAEDSSVLDMTNR